MYVFLPFSVNICFFESDLFFKIRRKSSNFSTLTFLGSLTQISQTQRMFEIGNKIVGKYFLAASFHFLGSFPKCTKNFLKKTHLFWWQRGNFCWLDNYKVFTLKLSNTFYSRCSYFLNQKNYQIRWLLAFHKAFINNHGIFIGFVITSW